MIQINIHIIKRLHIGQRIIYKNVIHIESMFRQLQSTFFQHMGTVNHRVHKNVLSQTEMFYVSPGKHFILRKCRCITHCFFMFYSLLIINIVADHHIRCFSLMHQFCQLRQHLRIIFLIQPVIAVYDFEIQAGGIFQTGVDCLSVTAVFLMYCFDNGWIFGSIFICNLCGSVFGRTVIHNDNLHLFSAGKQGFDAISHITFRIVTRNCD